MKEVWKFIDGFDEQYMVSNLGRVMSLVGKPQIRKQQVGKFGYVRVGLFRNGVQRKTGINSISIGDVCRGKSKTAGGYVWKYKE